MDYSQLMTMAQASILDMKKHQVFTVKDLFKGHYWGALSKKDRLGFGRYFKNQVKHGTLPNIEWADKNANNTNQYRII